MIKTFSHFPICVISKLAFNSICLYFFSKAHLSQTIKFNHFFKMGYPYLTLFLLPFLILQVSGHGMIAKPASRASLWRYEEFSEFNPPYYRNDRELHCGGFIVCIFFKLPDTHKIIASYLSNALRNNTGTIMEVAVPAAMLGNYPFHEPLRIRVNSGEVSLLRITLLGKTFQSRFTLRPLTLAILSFACVP